MHRRGRRRLLRRDRPFQHRLMTRRTFRTITHSAGKSLIYQAQETGKLRLHQLRNSPTAIKNAIKVIPTAVAAVHVSKRFPIARRSSVVGPISVAQATRLASYAILNKTVIFSPPPFPPPPRLPSTPKSVSSRAIYQRCRNPACR